jgi:hypothetical protein
VIHAVMDVPTALAYYYGGSTGDSLEYHDGVFFGSDDGTDYPVECPEGATNPWGTVLYDPPGTWETTAEHWGGWTFGWLMWADFCCPPLEYELCTPATDVDWATQGNGIGRTNATTANISNLCNVYTDWTYSANGAVMAISAAVAGDFVVFTSTDSITCLNRLTGAYVWSAGGYPLCIGDVRGTPTIDLADNAVYVGGSAAQSFTKYDMTTGAVIWSRNLGGGSYVPLVAGNTSWTGSIVSGGYVYFANETGYIYKLDVNTGVDAAGSPLLLPDAPGAVVYNALTSNGTKLFAGTASALGTAGNIHQIDMATLAVDWTLTGPGNLAYPGGVGDTIFDPYSPEGFPGSMAVEDGVLYYHSQIRNDGNGFLHFPQTGSVGAIDITVEDGTGIGILWVNNADLETTASPGLTPASTYNFAGPAIGPGMVYLSSRGFFGGVTEQDGQSAWHKTLGLRVWYSGYTNIGNSGGIPQLDDPRGCNPVTVFCDASDQPFILAGTVGGDLKLLNGNDGTLEWQRKMTGRVRQAIVVDEWIYSVIWTGDPVNGGGTLVAMTVGADRPRLQIDSLFVFRSASPIDPALTDDITNAFQNTGCAALNVLALNVVNVPVPPGVRVSSVHPDLAAASERSTRNLSGYDALLDASSWKDRAVMRSAGIETEDESLVRTFATNASAAADPVFLTVNSGTGAVAPGAPQSINITYDPTGLTNNTGFTNYIEVVTDDPDYYPQGGVVAVPGVPTTPGVPVINVNMFLGCPDASVVMTLGRGTMWITNWGAEGGAGNFAQDDATDGLVIDGDDGSHYDGGWYAAVNDDDHWAFEGCSVGAYPRRGGEWGPSEPCGVSIVAGSFNSPFDATAQNYEEVTSVMLDLSSTNGFFTPSIRQLGGLLLDVQRIGSADPAFGNFVLSKVVFTNEVGDPYDIVGTMDSVLFGIGTDWDVGAGTNNYMYKFSNGYAVMDGGVADGSAAGFAGGHANLTSDHHAVGAMGSGSAPTFMMGDILDDQGHGEAAYHIMDDPQHWADSIDLASTFNTDIGAYWTAARFDALADGASETLYMAIFEINNDGVHESWSDGAGFQAAVANVVAKAKAYAGLGAGDVNCDGAIDLADVVLLGNIVDGLFDPTGTGGEFAGDTDGDGDVDEDDYTNLYDVVSGVGGALVNAWRF